MLNKSILIGNVGSDAQINSVGENSVINFNLCTTRTWKNTNGEKMKKDTWFSCAYWVKNTVIAQYIKKGSLLYVEGEPEAVIYKNKDGIQVAQLKLNVSEIKLLSKPQQRDSTPETTPQEPLDESLPF